MRITVHYLAQLKRAAGIATESLDVAAGTLGHVVEELGERHDDAFRALLAQKALLFFVNDDHADLSRALRDGDEITILAPMAGGA
jgi:molybdopterin converting factor small subunit